MLIGHLDNIPPGMQLMNFPQPCPVYLDCCEQTAVPVPCAPVPKNKKGNNPMRQDLNVDLNVQAMPATSEIETQREYLRERIRGIYWAYTTEMEKKFGLSQDVPKDAEELIERIKTGKYQLPEKGKRNCYNSVFGLEFRRTELDRDGYDKAEKAFELESQALRDIIALKSIAEAFEAFQKFEKKHTVH